MKYTQADKKLPFGTRICEICGREGILEYMYAMGASWHVTGHFMVPSFSCQAEPTAQHWGCTPEHAMQALAMCLRHDRHMSVKLMRQKHAVAASEGKPKIAPEHRDLHKKYGDSFHFDFIEDLTSGKY